MKMTPEELKRDVLKNKKSYIGQPIFSDNIVGIIRDIDENGFIVEPTIIKKGLGMVAG